MTLQVQNHLHAFKIKIKGNLTQALGGHRRTDSLLDGPRWGKDHQKAAATGANELSAQSAILFGDFVSTVYMLITDLLGAAFLVLPMLVKQHGETLQIALLKRFLHLIT